MSYRIFSIQNISLSFPQKTCFENFSSEFFYGEKISIIGRNGSGKSSLLKILEKLLLDQNIAFGSVPQIVEDAGNCSGGERFQKALTKALASDPSVLLLDEPTNHLDVKNRSALFKVLDRFKGTLIVASHDTQLLRKSISKLWHIDQGKIEIFSGNYDDYMREFESCRTSQIAQLELLSKAQKKARAALEFEQKRASSSKKANKDENDRKLKGAMKEKGSATSGKKRGEVNILKNKIDETLQNFRLPEIITPKFVIPSQNMGEKMLVCVTNGSAGYDENLLKDIHFSCSSRQRIAIKGKNGSGKSTFLKAILGDKSVKITGDWNVINAYDIGFLDQHYSTLNPLKTVLENLEECVPSWSHVDLRKHLNDFLFRSNEEVMTKVQNLSGGEKARLSLALIASKTPKLLILDEITNNLDLETKKHIIEILIVYPGAMIVVSHDEDFLEAIHIKESLML